MNGRNRLRISPRKGLNDRLLVWKRSGGIKQTIADFIDRGGRNVMVVIGMSIVIIMIGLALLTPILPMAGPTDIHEGREYLGPSATNWFGTDNLGRDVFSRVAWGSRISLLVGTVAVLLSLTIGMILGLTAGFFGGKIDYVISGTIDLFWTFPAFLLALAFAAALGPGVPNLTKVLLAISVSYWAGFARLVRGQALTVRERQFVEASRALGARNSRLMFRHVLPNCLAPLIVWASIGVADAITIESSLSFLGVGTQPPTASWGYMLYSGKTYIEEAAWIAAFPGIAILITILGFNLLGDGLRDVFDPRLKGVRK
jgi:peptide/nickel transport system permease protein